MESLMEMRVSRVCMWKLCWTVLLHAFVIFGFLQDADGLKKSQLIENESKKVTIDHVEGVLGHRVELPCDISANRREDTVYMVMWFRESGGKPLYTFDVRGRGMKSAKTWSSKTGFDRRADFQAASYPAHLLVSDLKIGDQGVYRCRVDFKNSRTRNALVNLTVVVPPMPPVIYNGSDVEVSNDIGPYVEGTDVLLKCRVKGGKPEPVVSWYVNGVLEDSTYYINGYGDIVNELLFERVNRSHLNSQFTCKTSNTRLMQPVERSVTLDLDLKPLFVRLLQKQTDHVMAGKEYRVSCETAGSKPPATLKWIKGGREITQVNTQELDSGNVTMSTFIFVPTPDDNGDSLICRAENPSLNRTHILEEVWHLNVIYLPEVKLSLGSTLNPMEIKEGTDVYFECKILANPKISRLTWLFNGEELKHNVGVGVIMSNQSLVLQGINRKAAGNYTCVATNSQGSTQSNAVHLSVLYAPVCLAESGVTVGVTKGENVGLRCAVNSNPTAFRFEWEFHGSGDNIDVVPIGKTVSHGDLSRFFYTPIDSSFGTFLCWGSNSIGRQVQPCVFHVVPAVKPNPLEKCSILNQTDSMIHVECSNQREIPTIPDQPLFRIMNGGGESGSDDENGSGGQQNPSEYGIFPEYYVMEIWDMKTASIRRNLSAEIPLFIVRGILPGSGLRLVLYAANSHGRSEPVIIETLVAGDAETQVLGEGRGSSPMELSPLVVFGIGTACIGTILVFLLTLLLRSCVCSQSARPRHNLLRSNGTTNNSSSNTPAHCEKDPHGTSLMMMSSQQHSTTTTTNNSNSLNNSYRQFPLSKSELDTNPDIIPGANNFSAEYDDDCCQLTLRQPGVYISASGPVVLENYNSLARRSQRESTSSPSPADLSRSHYKQQQHVDNLAAGYSSVVHSYSGGSGNNYYQDSMDPRPPPPPHPSLVHPNALNFKPEIPFSNSQHRIITNEPNLPNHGVPHPSTASNGYNSLYIRDKFHDSHIPESCV